MRNCSNRPCLVEYVSRESTLVRFTWFTRFAHSAGMPADLNDILQDPELLEAFQDPEVSTAFADVSQNPANMDKYKDNPKVIICHIIIISIIVDDYYYYILLPIN